MGIMFCVSAKLAVSSVESFSSSDLMSRPGQLQTRTSQTYRPFGSPLDLRTTEMNDRKIKQKQRKTYSMVSKVKISFVGRLLRLPMQLERHMNLKQSVTEVLPGRGVFNGIMTELRPSRVMYVESLSSHRRTWAAATDCGGSIQKKDNLLWFKKTWMFEVIAPFAWWLMQRSTLSLKSSARE